MRITRTLSTTNLFRWALGFGCAVILVPSPPAQAQQWQFEPIVRLTANHSDNIRLARDDETVIDTSSLIVDANGRFARRSQTTEIRVAPRVRYRNFSESSEEDLEDFFLNIFADKTLERGAFGMQVRFAQEAVLTAEVDDPDFDNPDVLDPINLDTGRVRFQDDRNRLTFSPYFERRLSETLGLGVNASYVDVDYDKNQFGLDDYSSASVGLRLNFRATQRTSWSIGTFATDYENDDDTEPSESQSVGAEIQLRHQFSQRLDGRIAAGAEETDSDFIEGGQRFSDSDTSMLFSAGLTLRGEVSRAVLDLSQSIDPSGSGFLQRRSQFRLRYTRRLGPRTSGNIGVRIQNTEEVAAFDAQVERDYQWFQAGLEYRLSRKWSILGDYTFTTQEYSNEPADATSNAFSLSIVFDPARPE